MNASKISDVRSGRCNTEDGCESHAESLLAESLVAANEPLPDFEEFRCR
jgi:hypothetical protein